MQDMNPFHFARPLFCLAAALALMTALAVEACAETAEAPLRRAGAGFEFRHRPSIVDNPYCAITTYVVVDFPQQATSTMDDSGKPVIAIDASILQSDPDYAHFLMAHECCHHTLGHVRLTSPAAVGQIGPQPFYYIRPLLRSMELDADACATKMLSLTHEPDAIGEAKKKMLEFGPQPTGAYYPTGTERADGIERAAAGH